MNNCLLEIKVNDSGDEYVGIQAIDGVIKLYLPVGYNCIYNNASIKLSDIDSDFKREIYNLFLILCKKNFYSAHSNNIDGNFDFLSAIKVINDYNSYGLYCESELKQKDNYKGRINWAKTVRKNQLYLKNKIIYVNVVNEYIDFKGEKDIKQIQEMCLYSISKSIGFLFDFTYPKTMCSFNIKEIITKLENELKRTNDDVKHETISDLLDYIKCTDLKLALKGKISFKYKEFEYIFQSLVDYYGISDKSDYYPQARYLYWKNNNSFCECDKSYPDTIILDDIFKDNSNLIFVLDAKYKGISKLPNEYDVFKQIRYKKYVEKIILDKKIKFKKIYNVFVLPNDLHIKNVKVEIAPFYATSDDYLNREKIYVAYVDTKCLIFDPKNTMLELLDAVRMYDMKN